MADARYIHTSFHVKCLPMDPIFHYHQSDYEVRKKKFCERRTGRFLILSLLITQDTTTLTQLPLIGLPLFIWSPTYVSFLRTANLIQSC